MKPPDARLPIGFTVELNKTVTVRDAGRSLVGGSPTRAIYLRPAAADPFIGRHLMVSDPGSAALADKLLDIGMADSVLASLPAADESDVTYLILTCGRPHALDRMLRSIGPGKSVIVVDDASPDPSAAERITSDAGARFLALPVNVGPAGARNAGLRWVRTTYVVCVDNDMVVTDGAVAMLLRHFTDPRVALVAPRVVGLRVPTRVNWISRYEDARSSLDLGPTPATVRPRARISWVSTAFVVARVDALGTGFTEGMRVGEDVDLVCTLVEQG